MAVAFFCGSGRGMLRRWPELLPVVCNIASVVVAASTNEIRYLLPTFLLAVPSGSALQIRFPAPAPYRRAGFAG